jgi:hypothetical protein
MCCILFIIVVVFAYLYCVYDMYEVTYYSTMVCTKKETNSVALVRERTIPAERSPLVGEVGANFCG